MSDETSPNTEISPSTSIDNNTQDEHEQEHEQQIQDDDTNNTEQEHEQEHEQQESKPSEISTSISTSTSTSRPTSSSTMTKTAQQRGLIGGGGGSNMKKTGVPIHKSSRVSRKAQLPSLTSTKQTKHTHSNNNKHKKHNPHQDMNDLLNELYQSGSTKKGHDTVMGVNSHGDELDINHQSMFMKEEEEENGKSSSPPSVTTPSDMSHKQQLCIDILVHGHVNSYVDFFYLTHRVEEEGVKGNASDRTPIPDDKLSSIMTDLTGAEKAHRRGDSTLVFNSYQSLAKFFQTSGDYKTAVYFYEKCLEIAESTGDIEQQCNSQEFLGITHDAMGDIQAAIRFHERHLALASTLSSNNNNNKSETDTRLTNANHQLVDSYRRQAEEYEKNEQWPLAVECYKKCLQSAQDSNDLYSEGIATYRLGITCLAMNDRIQSIDYQQHYLNICKRTNDIIGEGIACSALATSFKELGDIKLAISYLEKYHQIAIKNKQTVAQAEACKALGQIYSAQGDHNTAVNYFEKTFEIARAVGDRKLVDAARINLGMARGNMALNNYFGVVKDNLPALLNWKTRRVAFKS